MECKGSTDELLSSVLSQLKALTQSVNTLVTGQASMNSKLDALNKRVDTIESSVKTQTCEINNIKLELQNCTTQTDLISLAQAQTESQVKVLQEAIESVPGTKQGINNPENTIVLYGVAESYQENLHTKVQELLQFMNKDSSKLTDVVRLKSRVEGKPGIVKASFLTVADKIDVLRGKQKLRGSKFGNVYMRTSKSHSERLMDINTKIILENSPWGKDYRVAANGRLVRKDASAASPQINQTSMLTLPFPPTSQSVVKHKETQSQSPHYPVKGNAQPTA